MNASDDKLIADPGSDLEREVRQRRKFTPQEAIGRLAGSGAMKGGSAISLQQQAENEISFLLGNHMNDSGGALRTVLHRQLEGSELLMENLDQPRRALAIHCENCLASAALLKDLVREADVEWGRAMDERPYFEREGELPNREDPYTIESVRRTLVELVRQIDL